MKSTLPRGPQPRPPMAPPPQPWVARWNNSYNNNNNTTTNTMSVPTIPGIKASPDLAQHFRQEVATLLRRGHRTNFPGAQPVSFARHHLDELETKDYYLCEKTDGIRCLLYCTTDENGQEIQYLIDRRNDYYYLDRPLHFPHHNDPNFAEFHSGTLIDGELVNDHEPDGVVLRYLAFDLLAVDGESLVEKRFQQRIARLTSFIMEPYKRLCARFADDVKAFPFEVRAKKLEKPYGIEMLFKDILPSLPHGNDGLIFQCADSPYTMGTDASIVKWKPPHENTVDFLLQLGDFPTFDPHDGRGPAEDYDAKPGMNLCIHKGRDEYEVFAQLHLADDEWEAMKRLREVLDMRIVECYKDDRGRWRCKMDGDGPAARPRFRDDKHDANHVSTVQKVLESIDDAVSERDLISHALPMKTAWKKRHPEEDRQRR